MALPRAKAASKLKGREGEESDVQGQDAVDFFGLHFSRVQYLVYYHSHSLGFESHILHICDDEIAKHFIVSLMNKPNKPL